jgi:SWI/SNF-related matrix-associated actin-dependent regulator of chromatin subfamily A member 5
MGDFGGLLTSQQDSDTQPNTTASSVAGDIQRVDGRKRRSEATQLRKSMFGKKLNKLDQSKACTVQVDGVG